MKKLYFLSFLVFSLTVKANWHNVKFDYKISNEKIVLNENKKTGTLLDELIKMNQQNIEDLIDKNSNTIKIVKISYQAPFRMPKDQANGKKAAKMIEVKQQGLLVFFADSVKDALISKNSKLKMQYDTKNPINVRFVLDGAIIPAPALANDNIDDKWKTIRK